MDLLPLIQNVGLPVAMVVFFLWAGHIREQRMAGRLDEMEKLVTDRLIGVIEENTATQRENTATQKQVVITLERLERECGKHWVQVTRGGE